MADIEVQRRRPNWWAWIIGLLVLIIAVWLIVEALDTDEPEVAEEVVPEVTEPPVGEPLEEAEPSITGEVSEVAAFADFVESPEPEMGLEHEYTSEGITRLAAALDAVVTEVANGDVEIEAARDNLVQQAQEIQQDPMADTHAQQVHEAFMTASNLIGQLQDRHFPGLEQQATELEQAAAEVEPTGDVLDQREAVRNFFTQANEAIQGMVEEQV